MVLKMGSSTGRLKTVGVLVGERMDISAFRVGLTNVESWMTRIIQQFHSAARLRPSTISWFNKSGSQSGQTHGFALFPRSAGCRSCHDSLRDHRYFNVFYEAR